MPRLSRSFLQSYEQDGREYEVRYKTPKGVFSRHFFTMTPEQARNKGQTLGNVVSVRKVSFNDVFGSIENMTLKEICFGKREPERNPMLTDMTLDGILFPKKLNRRSKSAESRQQGFRERRGADWGTTGT